MARTISAPIGADQVTRAILRAVYYNQELPAYILTVGTEQLAAFIKAVRAQGYIAPGRNRLVLTDLGRARLKKLSKGRLPPMIDFPIEDMIPKSAEREFIVGRSLASAIAKQVSAGE